MILLGSYTPVEKYLHRLQLHLGQVYFSTCTSDIIIMDVVGKARMCIVTGIFRYRWSPVWTSQGLPSGADEVQYEHPRTMFIYPQVQLKSGDLSGHLRTRRTPWASPGMSAQNPLDLSYIWAEGHSEMSTWDTLHFRCVIAGHPMIVFGIRTDFAGNTGQNSIQCAENEPM